MRVEPEVADVGLVPAHHQRQERLAVPRRRDLGLAVHLVGAGHLVGVLAAGHEPRPDDVLVLVDRPHALAGALVDDPPSRPGVRRDRRRAVAGARHRRQRVPPRVDRAGGRRWRPGDERLLLGPDLERQRGLATDDAVDVEVALFLHLLHGVVRRLVELARHGAGEVAGGSERALQAAHALAGLTVAQREHGHRAPFASRLRITRQFGRRLVVDDVEIGQRLDGGVEPAGSVAAACRPATCAATGRLGHVRRRERLDLVGRRRIGLRAAPGQGDDDQPDRRGEHHDDRDPCLTVALGRGHPALGPLRLLVTCLSHDVVVCPRC